MKKGDLIFKTKPDRGFVFTVWEGLEGKGDAVVEIERDGKLVKEFTFPAYKIWNIAAHSGDIIQSELNKDVEGYLIAGSDGLGGNVFSRKGEEKKLLYFSAVCNCENKLVATFWDGKPADFTCSKCKKKYLFCVSNELTSVMDYLKRLEK